MSALAHASLGAPGFEAEKKAAADRAKREIIEARRLQRETGCSWTAALRVARDRIRRSEAAK